MILAMTGIANAQVTTTPNQTTTTTPTTSTPFGSAPPAAGSTTPPATTTTAPVITPVTTPVVTPAPVTVPVVSGTTPSGTSYSLVLLAPIPAGETVYGLIFAPDGVTPLEMVTNKNVYEMVKTS